MTKVVLIRHGESVWNKENLFTGWTDVVLSDKGVLEAKKGGVVLKKEGFNFDIAYTSLLTRAIKTLDLALEELGLSWIPVQKCWELNERHYGSLQGLNKSQTAEKYGEDQVKIWRRSYDTPPPPLEKSDERYPGHDKRYAGLTEKQLPLTECLKDTVDRVIPFWDNVVLKDIKEGKSVVVVAHGNSLRALVKHLEGISDDDIIEINIPTGMPLVFELDDNYKAIKKYYLGDPEEVKAAMDAVANQGKKK